MAPNRIEYNFAGAQSVESFDSAEFSEDDIYHIAPRDIDDIGIGLGNEVHRPVIRGNLFLVGSGPGDPELLTMAAYRHLCTADLVVSDRLIPQEILKLVTGDLKIARKHPGNADAAQVELMDWCMEGILRGQKVVRLKNGDPFLYGRGGEEVNYFRRFHIDPVVIPGISSSLSAPLLAGIPPTHRGVADQVLIATAHGKNDTIPDLPPYARNRTTIFLMSIGRLNTLTKGLMQEAGFPTDTPAAIIEKASHSNGQQRVFKSTLEHIARIADLENVKPPGVVVVGHTVNAITENYKF
ncbi:hypothetical protein SARC_07205 [Sphaeroforma arctica JP610]|uniref:uroporphyrinogen-III C-methyltransferase n=1 Tax=Sphaeroforma arctica JP610 TaxID=667725 RepID=A0A0L0FUW3_9EUKA|nr:hypothetical protein SARC_07205 [Sphaeroforma arctica JP610]KNC80434.1 hypothetical protein SARC_07205 [Sphaeroforma arctica JP610]|eukprot:XP_014154336.1 hypothetical protein SARC_07205 [Sphaeroforma arctica JP610]